MRLIDADKFEVYTCVNKSSDYVDGVQSMLEAIDSAPTVDAVEVVRCKGCKHQCKIWHADKRMKEKGYWIYSCKRNSDPFVSHTVNGYDDEYCCYGERKKGENDNGDENTL